MGYDIDKMIESAKKGDTEKLLASLNENDAKRIKQLISDKEATEKLLGSEQAKKIMEMLKRGGLGG
jgi:hypothetical protein